MKRLIGQDPARSAIREWIASFAYGAGKLIFDLLLCSLMSVEPLGQRLDTAPPRHHHRVPSPTRRRRLERAHRFWWLAEHLGSTQSPMARPRPGCLTLTSRPINCSPLSSIGSELRGFPLVSSGRRVCPPLRPSPSSPLQRP